jgi:hypothetical protein
MSVGVEAFFTNALGLRPGRFRRSSSTQLSGISIKYNRI